MKRIVIIGGGISGLAAAYKLQELTAEQPCEIILLEASSRFGGVLQTERRDGFILEGGPDCFLSEKPAALNLVKRLNLQAELIETNPFFRRSFIYSGGRLAPVPQGFYLMAPRSLAALFAAPLLSISGKIRMACEPFIPARSGGEDESVAGFVRRRLGREALEKIAQPMIGGIYTADPEKLSLAATFPKFLEMERSSGSILRGLPREKKHRHPRMFLPARGQVNGLDSRLKACGNDVETKRLQDVEAASGPRYSLFLSFRNGMQSLTDALIQKLTRVTLRTDFPVKEIVPQGGKWMVRGEKGEDLEADAVCVSLPSHRAAVLLEKTSPDLAGKLAAISYESVATINLVYRREQIGHPLDGFGFVVPDTEKKKIMACTFASVKFPGRAPEGYVLLRAFAGGALRPEIFGMSDAALQQSALEELQDALKIKGAPVSVSIRRWPRSMPQYHVGHLELVRVIEEKTKEFPGLFLTGSAYRGVGIPDCIEQAEKTAEDISVYLNT